MSKSLQKGVAHIALIIIIVVVLIAIVVVSFGDFNFSVTKTGEDSPPAEVGEDTSPMVYENSAYGFSLTYPSGWKLQEGSSADAIVTVFAPREGAADDFTENLIVAITDLSTQPDLTSSDVMDLWVAQNAADPGFDSFSEAGRESTTLAGHPAEQVVYTASGQGLEIKGMVTIGVWDNTAYILNYTAEATSFDSFLTGILSTVSSFLVSQ